MTQKTTFFPLGGGLDLVSPAISVPSGSVIGSMNYEPHQTGYQRLAGIERFDGRISPTDAYLLAAEGDEQADMDAARTAITAVPGSGPVRGVWSYNDVVYAFRNNTAGTACEMWKSTASGWTLVSSAFPAGGRYQFINHNFYGHSNLKKMYGVNGVGQAFEYDGTTMTFINTGMDTDAPTRVAAHKQHLFLAFTGGSVQHSATGDPLSWSPIMGAAELAMGDEITDFIEAQDALAVLSRGSVALLYGNDATDWQLQRLSSEAGALPWTAERMGQPVYMDNRGIRSLSATQAYGNFEVGSMSSRISPLLRGKAAADVMPLASVRSRSRDLYRVFFSDGTGLSMLVGKKVPDIMPFDIGRVVNCACSVEGSDLRERIYVGCTDGFVYQMDKGKSLDGDAMPYYLRLPFLHLGAPQVIKRFHKAEIELASPAIATIRVSGETDYGDQNEPGIYLQNFTVYGGGGFWDTSFWDQFSWSTAAESRAEAYLDVVGKNMSLLIGGEVADEDPHLLQGLTLYYSVRGLTR